jgi:hypothetical protein
MCLCTTPGQDGLTAQLLVAPSCHESTSQRCDRLAVHAIATSFKSYGCLVVVEAAAEHVDVALVAEHTTESRGVPGSSPGLATDREPPAIA